MIDLHSHILPGIDDGAPDMASAVAMAREASSHGIQKVVATPHVDHKYDTRASTVKSLVASLNEELARKSIPLEVLPGAEVAAYRLADLGERELRELGLGGGPYTLVEAPLSATAGDFEIFLNEPAGGRRRYVLAHPERSPLMQRDPDRLRRLVLDGVLVSITASSLSGRFGGTVRRFAVSLLELGLVHNVASDMHDVSRRPPGIAEHLRSVSASLPGILELEDWLASEVPAAVIAGRPVMMPPKLTRSRKHSFGLGRIVRYARER